MEPSKKLFLLKPTSILETKLIITFFINFTTIFGKSHKKASGRL